MSLTNEFQINDQVQHPRLIELEGDGNQAFRSLVERDYITSVESFYMTQLPSGLISLAVLASSESAGPSLWFDEIYSTYDALHVVERLILGAKSEDKAEEGRIKALGAQASKWLNDGSEMKLPFKVIDSVSMEVGSILNSLRFADEA